MELIDVEIKEGRFRLIGKIMIIGEDILAIIGGGKIHIGAVGLSFPPSFNKLTSTSIITVPGHKDDVICKKIGEKLAKKFKKIVTTVSGIHYDDLKKEDIEKILNLSEKLADKIVKILENKNE